ncbi:MAG: hypothetical protein WAQ28_00715 [Bacteroidia bacterium]|jgi:hypothetical protein
MKTLNLAKYLMVAATVGILLNSCRKKEDEPEDKDTSAAADNAIAEGYFNDANSISDQAAAGNLTSFLSTNDNSDGERGIMSGCATITHDTMSNPRTITINFGTTNCLCNDGRYRRGIINVTYTGHYKDSLSFHTITFSNYFVNDNQVLGSKTVTNNGHNNAGHLTFSISVNGSVIKANNGGTITYTSTRTREWIEGEYTSIWSDDVYLITGTASGSSSSGSSFTATIITALKIKLNCHWIVSGKLDLTPSGKPTRTIDWGSGNCDDDATVTINGNTYNINLN